MEIRVDFHELIDKVIQYGMIYLMWLISGSQIANLHTSMLYVVCFFVSVWFLLTRKVIPSWDYLVLAAFTVGSVILIRVINHGGIGIGACFSFMLNLYIPYLVYMFHTNTFVERYIKFTVCFCLISLFIFVLGKWNYSFTRSLFWSEQQVNRWVVYSGKLFYVLRNSELGRNNGLFTEPGLFQIPINTAIFFILFYKEQLKCSVFKKIIYFIILGVAIVTVQSTTGYIAFGLLVVTWFFTRDNIDYLHKIGLLLCFCGAGVLLLYAIVQGEENLIYQVLIRKVLGVFTSGESGNYRTMAIGAFFDRIWWNYPLGAGYDNYQAIMKNYGVNSAGYALATGAGFFSLIAIYGIPLMVTVYSWIVLKARQNIKEGILVVLFIILYVNTALGQSTCIYATLSIMAIVKKNQFGE